MHWTLRTYTVEKKDEKPCITSVKQLIIPCYSFNHEVQIIIIENTDNMPKTNHIRPYVITVYTVGLLSANQKDQISNFQSQWAVSANRQSRWKDPRTSRSGRGGGSRMLRGLILRMKKF